jgi:hypothetical protein
MLMQFEAVATVEEYSDALRLILTIAIEGSNPMLMF